MSKYELVLLGSIPITKSQKTKVSFRRNEIVWTLGVSHLRHEFHVKIYLNIQPHSKHTAYTLQKPT